MGGQAGRQETCEIRLKYLIIPSMLLRPNFLDFSITKVNSTLQVMEALYLSFRLSKTKKISYHMNKSAIIVSQLTSYIYLLFGNLLSLFCVHYVLK